MATTANRHDGQATVTLFRMFLQTFSHLRQINEPYFARYGISGAQWAVLRNLQRAHEEGKVSLRLTDLGGRLLIRPPSVTGVVDRLERMGMVRRSPSRKDLRARELSLTAEGRRLVDRIQEQHASHIASLFGGLSHRERENLLGLLQRLDEHLSTMAGPEVTPGRIGK